mgnify:CR=1 FL=1
MFFRKNLLSMVEVIIKMSVYNNMYVIKVKHKYLKFMISGVTLYAHITPPPPPPPHTPKHLSKIQFVFQQLYFSENKIQLFQTKFHFSPKRPVSVFQNGLPFLKIEKISIIVHFSREICSFLQKYPFSSEIQV